MDNVENSFWEGQTIKAARNVPNSRQPVILVKVLTSSLNKKKEDPFEDNSSSGIDDFGSDSGGATGAKFLGNMIGKPRDKDLKRKELKRKAIATDEVDMEQFQFSEATFYVSPNSDW